MAHTNFVSPIRKTAYQPLVQSKKKTNSTLETQNSLIFRHFQFLEFSISKHQNIKISSFQTSTMQTVISNEKLKLLNSKLSKCQSCKIWKLQLFLFQLCGPNCFSSNFSDVPPGECYKT